MSFEDELLAEILAAPMLLERFALMTAVIDLGRPHLAVEFGVFQGQMLNHIAAKVPEVWGFDSFDGLPEDWAWGNEVLPRGVFQVPFEDVEAQVRGNCKLVKGLFKDTLAQAPSGADLIHIDCDLYSSTKEVMGWVEAQRPGTLVIFDELCDFRGRYPQWREGEWRALCESPWRERFRPLARTTWEQVAFRLED